MTFVVLIPTLVASCLAAWKGFRSNLVYWTLPCLLCLPAYYQLDVAGLPDASFHNYLLLISLGAAFLGRDRGLIRFESIDLIVLGFVSLVAFSEVSNKGFAEGRNLLALRVMGTLAPWYLGKALARHNGLLCGALVSIALTGAAIGFFAVFEARMGENLFDSLRAYWPTTLPWEHALYRFGLRRSAGPFAHPICQGFFFSMLIPLFLWLRRERLLRSGLLRGFATLGILAGFFAAGSRGPWLGGAFASALTFVSWRKDRALALGVAAMVLGGAALFGTVFFEDYVRVGRAAATTESQETAAYRWEALDAYLVHVAERPVLGFGKDRIPVVHRLESIDNQYLWMTLIHGLPAALLFLASILVPAVQLFRRAARAERNDALTRLGFALSATLFGALLTQVTVFAGTQTEQLLFLLGGLAAGLCSRLSPAR